MNKCFGNGRYQVLDKLGTGGMAIVYMAQDTLLNRIVTIKVLRDQFASDEDFLKRFRREAQAVASLSHPNIVSVYDVGKDEEQEYIVMEYVQGRNLKEYIKENAPLPMEKAIDIAQQICGALDHAHKHQIIHRDIKPHNILLTPEGVAKVTDFGIARAVSAATVTHTGTIVGSVHYFSPEQARGEITGGQSDIYSLGIILYEMVTGQVPFDGESPIAIALKHMNEKAQLPSAINPKVPKNLEQVIERAIAKYPEERYPTALRFKEDLTRVLQGLETTPFVPSKRVSANEATQVIRAPKEALTAEMPKEDGPEPPANVKPKRKIKPIGWVAIAIVILAIIGGAYAWVSSYLNVPDTTMPDLTNLTVTQASEKLKLNKLQLNAENVKYEYNDTVKQNQIIRQDPPANSVIKINRPDVTVWVSQGPELATMPDLISTKTDKDTALTEIQKAGFTSTPSVQYANDDTTPVNDVIRQSPAPNAQTAKNGPVSIVISKGPAAKTIQMPNVVGSLQADATDILSQQQLTVTTETQGSNTYLKGYVIQTQPAANQSVLQGSQVKLIVSAGPGPVPKQIPTQDISDAVSNLKIPDDKKSHEVTIKLSDLNGVQTLYDFPYTAGTQFTPDKPVPYLPPAKLQIFVDKNLSYEQDYN
ncbi:MAG TPA: Stk1 family PASTA domain-containing Ser/Thr kinase [Desulfobacteria bacterium]|nr:Stk1 family PASTA domain-containing Ser/Thr kinase [Desulfobacteria bacterium]